jgi:hypothetical protein
LGVPGGALGLLGAGFGATGLRRRICGRLGNLLKQFPNPGFVLRRNKPAGRPLTTCGSKSK